MPGHKKRTNLLLLLIAVLLCSGSALLFSQSSAEPSMIKDGTIELFVPKGIDDSNSTSDTEKQGQVSSQNENSQKEVPSVSPTATPTPVPNSNCFSRSSLRNMDFQRQQLDVSRKRNSLYRLADGYRRKKIFFQSGRNYAHRLARL